MKILGLIPARGGSKGVPGKNIRLLNGMPLIEYTIRSAREAHSLTRLMLSTDDPDIRETGQKLGAEAPFMRPAELASDHAPTLPVVQHALSWLAENENAHFDAVCLLQPTCPFRPPGFIDQAIEVFIRSGTDALVSVLPVPPEFNPHWVFEADSNGLLHISTGEENIIPRRQELPAAWFRDGSIYLTKTEVISHQNSLYGNSLAYIESDPSFYCNIDTMEDWSKAELMARKIQS